MQILSVRDQTTSCCFDRDGSASAKWVGDDEGVLSLSRGVEKGSDQSVRSPSPPPEQRDCGRMNFAVALLGANATLHLLPPDPSDQTIVFVVDAGGPHVKGHADGI